MRLSSAWTYIFHLHHTRAFHCKSMAAVTRRDIFVYIYIYENVWIVMYGCMYVCMHACMHAYIMTWRTCVLLSQPPNESSVSTNLSLASETCWSASHDHLSWNIWSSRLAVPRFNKVWGHGSSSWTGSRQPSKTDSLAVLWLCAERCSGWGQWTGKRQWKDVATGSN